MGFPIQNDHFGVFWGYHHLRKPPYRMLCFFSIFFCVAVAFPVRRYDASSATTGAAIADSIGSQAHAEWWCKCCCGDKGRLHHGNTQRMTIENQTIWRCISYLNMWLSSLPSWFFWGRPCFFFGMKHHAANLRPFIWMHFFKDVRVWRYLANQKTGRLIWILIMYNVFFLWSILRIHPQLIVDPLFIMFFFGGDGISYNPHITG